MDILFSVFDGELIIPAQVYEELSRMKSFKNSDFVFFNIEREIQKNKISVVAFNIDGGEASLYLAFIEGKITGKVMGKGEASAVSIAQFREGTVASNNFSDIAAYCRKAEIPFICTDEILYMAYVKGYISVEEGENIRNEMKKRKRKLGEGSFIDMIKKYSQHY
jgi:predicted nucleic acid-binding protein